MESSSSITLDMPALHGLSADGNLKANLAGLFTLKKYLSYTQRSPCSASNSLNPPSAQSQSYHYARQYRQPPRYASHRSLHWSSLHFDLTRPAGSFARLRSAHTSAAQSLRHYIHYIVHKDIYWARITILRANREGPSSLCRKRA